MGLTESERRSPKKPSFMSKESLGELLYNVWFPFLERFQVDRERVLHYKEPEALAQELDLSLCPEKSFSEESFEQLLADVIEYTPNAWSPEFLNYLYSSPDPIGLIGDWLVSLVNSNVHAYEASPVFALAEMEVIKALAKIVGYGTDSDGIFCPGGSYSNMFAMHLARRYLLPDATTDGLWEKEQLGILTSEQSHYSIEKAAIMLGFGTKSVTKIKCDRKGRMQPDDLRQKMEEANEQGKNRFFVNATLGTTVLGAFDPLSEIAELLSSHRSWLHVDAAWGGAALMSEKRRNTMKGIEKANSITWDLHKALRAPLLCSALLVRNAIDLINSVPVDASYLFHGDKEEENYHLGEKTAQCGRRGDAFKFWLMWKMRGKEHFAQQVESRFSKTAKAIEMIKSRQCFRLYDDHPDFWNICFWYIPAHLRKLGSLGLCTKEQKTDLGKLTESIYNAVKKDGQILVNYAKIRDYPACIRLIPGHNLTSDRLKKILDIIESFGNVLSSNLQEILISGGDTRLHLDSCGRNYILISPEPAPKNLIPRSSCTGSFISEENYRYLEGLHADIRSAKIPFHQCMEKVHENMRDILKIDSRTSIITVPSGTDAEYIPLLVAKAYAGNDNKIANIVTAAGEIGTHSATAANGLYYTAIAPSGAKVAIGKGLGGICDNVEMIMIPQKDPVTGKQDLNNDIWMKHVKESLSSSGTLVLLHIVDSSKLGRRMDVIDEVEDLMMRYPGRILVAIDSCQSRTDISRTRHYLKLGYMVMITGSKFEEGPPFCGAVIVSAQLTDPLTVGDFADLLPKMGDFVTRYDVSGHMDMIRPHLPYWKNWGLMMRWNCALANWENYRNIGDESRNPLIQNWLDGILKLIDQYQEMDIVGGGEIQPGAVGDRNTIISVKLNHGGAPLPIEVLKRIHHWLYEDMSDRFPDDIRLDDGDREILKRSFLIGKPVDLGGFAVLRIALGAKLACFIKEHGLNAALADDRALLQKLYLLTKHHRRISLL